MAAPATEKNRVFVPRTSPPILSHARKRGSRSHTRDVGVCGPWMPGFAGMTIFHLVTERKNDSMGAEPARAPPPQPVAAQRGAAEQRGLLVARVARGEPLVGVPQYRVAAHALVDRKIALE